MLAIFLQWWNSSEKNVTLVDTTWECLESCVISMYLCYKEVKVWILDWKIWWSWKDFVPFQTVFWFLALSEMITFYMTTFHCSEFSRIKKSSSDRFNGRVILENQCLAFEMAATIICRSFSFHFVFIIFFRSDLLLLFS